MRAAAPPPTSSATSARFPQAELKENPGLGYQPSSQVGQSGLEHEYEQYLRGVAGKDELSVNAENQVVGTLHKSQPQEGDILVTNLDTNLQLAVQQALDDK